MGDWNKIDRCWRVYAEERNFELDVADRNYMHGVNTSYQLTFGGVVLKSTIRKSNPNIMYTSVLTINGPFGGKDYEFKAGYIYRKFFMLWPKDPVKALMRAFDLSSFEKNENRIIIKMKWMPETREQFKQIEHLIASVQDKYKA